MTPLACLVSLATVLCIVCVATSSDDFRPGYVSAIYISHRKLRVHVNYTSSVEPHVRSSVLYKGEIQNFYVRKHDFSDGQGEVMCEMAVREGVKLPVNFTFTLPQTTFTLMLHPFPPPEDRIEPIPDVHLEPEGDIVYAESGDVSVDVTVTAGEAYESVVGAMLSYTSYVREGEFFYVSEDWPISIVGQPASDSGAVYRLDFNTSEFRPEGVLVMKALMIYSDQGSGPQLVQAVQVEQRVDFYQQGHAPPVNPDPNHLALVRLWTDTMGRSEQVCDLALTPACPVTCAVVASEPPNVTIVDLSYWKYPSLENSVTTSKMGFLTVTTAPVPKVSGGGDTRLGCTAMRGWDHVNKKTQQILLKARDSARILMDGSSAVLHPNKSLEVRCRTTGVPIPEVTISDPEDPANMSLAERFPNESFLRSLEINRHLNVQYWLSKPSFTSGLSQVRCSAYNGYKEPDVVLFNVTKV